MIAHNSDNLWRPLVLPNGIRTSSLTSLQQRLVKTGRRLIRHVRSTGHCWRGFPRKLVEIGTCQRGWKSAFVQSVCVEMSDFRMGCSAMCRWSSGFPRASVARGARLTETVLRS